MGWNLVEGNGLTELFTCGLRKEITSSFNQKFIADFELDEINTSSFDALAIPGGFENYGYYNDAYDDKFLNFIRSFRAENKIIATICVGALPLGKSGELSGKTATTYHNPIRRQALKDFGATVLHQPVVFDDGIITSWNPSTAIDVAFLLLEKLSSRENADNVRKLMGFWFK